MFVIALSRHEPHQVTDFGVSAALQSSTAMCRTFVGTYKYMSPERMKSEKYSYSSDIWSLGLVLMECGTNVYPYRVSTAGRREGGGVVKRGRLFYVNATNFARPLFQGIPQKYLSETSAVDVHSQLAFRATHLRAMLLRSRATQFNPK